MRSKDTSLCHKSSSRSCAVHSAPNCSLERGLNVKASCRSAGNDLFLWMNGCTMTPQAYAMFLISHYVDCKFTCHQKCAEKVFIKCISSRNVEDPDEAKFAHRIPHRFETFTNLSPTWCSHCGHMLTFGRRHKKCTGMSFARKVERRQWTVLLVIVLTLSVL